MPQGIRRTNLMQARTQDPFEALLRTDAQRMARDQQSKESLLAREAKRGMFDEEMLLNRDKFAEAQSQNDIANANAAARLGLARAAAGKAGKGLTWMQKELFKEQMYNRGKGVRYKDYSKDNSNTKNRKGLLGTTIPSDVSSNMKANDLTELRQMERNMYADNESKADIAAAVSDRIQKIHGLNLFNYNDYGLTDKSF